MGRESAERYLPQALLQRATLRGNEYAWRLDDIPLVIQAAKEANLVSIGGQLQFRIPDGGTCECYWVDVDTYRSVSTSLPWPERVVRAAEAGLGQFECLKTEFDFVHEGRGAFERHLAEAEANGYDLEEIMCFVWYVLSEAEEAERDLCITQECFSGG